MAEVDLVAEVRLAAEQVVVGKIDRQAIADALNLSGFENWRSEFSRVPAQIRADGSIGELEFEPEWASEIGADSSNSSIVFRPDKRPTQLPGTGRVAAVLLLLFPIDLPATTLGKVASDPDVEFFLSDHHQQASGEHTAFALTQRPTTMTDHAGQISLPGGKQEPNETLIETALRETEEEIGLGRSSIEVIGTLKTVYIPPSDFTIHPFVGWFDDRAPNSSPSFIRNDSEVAKILVPSIHQLAVPGVLDRGIVESGNDADGEPRRLEVPFYRLGKHRVWGATGIVISELMARLKKLNQIV